MTKLQKWQINGIEDWGGVVSDDFKQFSRDFKSFLNRVCKANGWELVKYSPNHYDCSWFIRKEDKYAYCSFSDVRYFSSSWYKNILYRTASSPMDYHGGSNSYSSMNELGNSLKRLFARVS